MFCTVANSSPCKVLGSYNIPFRARDKVKIINILVIPSLPHCLILRFDFWKKMGIVPNVLHGEWTFANCVEFSLPEDPSLWVSEAEELSKFLEGIFADTRQSEMYGIRGACYFYQGRAVKTTFLPLITRHVDETLDAMLALG